MEMGVRKKWITSSQLTNDILTGQQPQISSTLNNALYQLLSYRIYSRPMPIEVGADIQNHAKYVRLFPVWRVICQWAKNEMVHNRIFTYSICSSFLFDIQATTSEHQGLVSMPQLENFYAWVFVDGDPLEEYGIEYSADGTRVTCWVASREDKVKSSHFLYLLTY